MRTTSHEVLERVEAALSVRRLCLPAHFSLVGVLALACSRSGTATSPPAVATSVDNGGTKASTLSERTSAAARSGRSLPESSESYSPDLEPSDEWTRENGRPMPNVLGETLSIDGAPLDGLSARCKALYVRFAQKPAGQFGFVCAISTSGEAWASIASLSLPPNKETQVAVGTWQLFAEGAGRVARSAPQYFQLFAAHAGGACQSDPAPCLQYGHYAGLLPPRGFAFLKRGANQPDRALAIGREEINTDRPPELSLTLWRIASNSVELDDLSRRAGIAGYSDCSGDERAELAINPYRLAGDSFVLRFEAHARATSELWTELFELRVDGSWSNDGDLSRRYAARLCPNAPGNPFQARGSRWPASLHCAKLWGQTSAELHAALNAACSKPQDDETSATCRNNRKVLEHMIDTKLPALLPAAPAAPLPRGCFDDAMANGESASDTAHE